jgi:hypothetical protein
MSSRVAAVARSCDGAQRLRHTFLSRRIEFSDDRADVRLSRELCRSRARNLLADRFARSGGKLRISARTARHGCRSGKGSDGGTSAGHRSGHRRRKVARVFDSRGSLRTDQKKKAIVSTYTINLQEQLIFKDLPIVQKLLPFEFEAMLWKGRRITSARCGSNAR